MGLGFSIAIGTIVFTVIMLLVMAAVAYFFVTFFLRLLRSGAVEKKPKITDPVTGQFTLTGASIPIFNAIHQTGNLTGVVSAPGMKSAAATFQGLIPTAKFPAAGQVLPVIMDRADPTNFVIEWDKVAAGTEKAMGRAQHLAEEMNNRPEQRG